jgi:hypothetical protein
MDTPFAGEMINLARLFAFAMLLLFIVQAARRDQPLGRAAVFGLACVATLVVCPVARGCYFALFLPAIVFVSMWLLQLGRPRTAIVLSIVPVVAIWLHYVAVTFSGRIGLLGLCTAAWFLGTCAILDKCLATRRSDPKCVKLAIPANLNLLEPV